VGERTGEVDHRKVLGGLSYTTLANKTYSFTKEERDFVLELRALGLKDGNGYAEANYKLVCPLLNSFSENSIILGSFLKMGILRIPRLVPRKRCARKIMENGSAQN